MADAIRLQTEALEYEIAVVVAVGFGNDAAAGIDVGVDDAAAVAAAHAAAVAAS